MKDLKELLSVRVVKYVEWSRKILWAQFYMERRRSKSNDIATGVSLGDPLTPQKKLSSALATCNSARNKFCVT